MPKVRNHIDLDEDGVYVGDVHHSHRSGAVSRINPIDGDPRTEEEIDNTIEYKYDILPKIRERSEATILDCYKSKLAS